MSKEWSGPANTQKERNRASFGEGARLRGSFHRSNQGVNARSFKICGCVKYNMSMIAKTRSWSSTGKLVVVKENRLMSSRSLSSRGGGGACDHVI